jgi:hypothetical protein
MLKLFGLDMGTPFQGGAFLALIGIFGISVPSLLQGGGLVTLFVAIMGGVTMWIRGMADRGRVVNETKALDATQMEKVLADYAIQVQAFRGEVHELRNELQAVRGELHDSDRVSQQRNERISTMELIVELLITELARLDPGSIIVAQARMMMRRVGSWHGDPSKSHEMNSAEGAVADAKQTVASAQRTVADLQASEDRAGQDGDVP